MGAILFAIAIFFVGIITDLVWTHWTIAASSGRAIRAGIFAALIVVVGLLSFDAYSRSYFNVIPFAAGCFIGTYIAVRSNNVSNEIQKKAGSN